MQRFLGRLIQEGQKNGELRKQNAGTRVSSEKELTDLGIDKKESHIFQQIAKIPDEKFEAKPKNLPR